MMNTVLLGSWDESYALAHKVVSQMTVDEKVGVLTGVTFAKSAFSLFLFLLVLVSIPFLFPRRPMLSIIIACSTILRTG